MTYLSAFDHRRGSNGTAALVVHRELPVVRGALGGALCEGCKLCYLVELVEVDVKAHVRCQDFEEAVVAHRRRKHPEASSFLVRVQGNLNDA